MYSTVWVRGEVIYTEYLIFRFESAKQFAISVVGLTLILIGRYHATIDDLLDYNKLLLVCNYRYTVIRETLCNSYGRI